MKKLYIKLFILLLTLLFSRQGYAQYTYYAIPNAFNGTSGSGRGPVTSIAAHRSCAIYAASEFTGYINAGDSIFRMGFIINTNSLTAPVSGTVKIYMINTPNSTYLKSTYWDSILMFPARMDTNYIGAMTIPAAAGPYFVSLQRPFVYTGGGVYVAYEWTTSTPGTAASIYQCNTGITNGQRNIQGASLTTLTNLTGVSSFRAQLYMGLKTPVNDAQVLEVYSLGKLPIPFAVPHTVKARVKNGGADTLYGRKFYMTVGPNNPFVDSVAVDTLLPAQEKTISFTSYTSYNVGQDTVTVYCIPDNNNSNNLKRYGQIVNLNTYNYADPLKIANGGVGFTGGTGDFVAKFPYTGSNSINQIGVNFSAGGTTLKVGIWDTSATGTPGTLLWSSAPFLTSAGLNTIPVNPPVAISGTFFVGVIQTSTTNASFSYQAETPIRAGTFYYTSPTGSTTWTDFLSTNSNFRFMVEPRLQLANDLGATAISNPCSKFPQGQSGANPEATFYNYGSITQFGIPVKTKIFNASNALVFSDSAQISFIFPGSSYTVNFPSAFTPTAAGVYTMKTWSELPGDGDHNNDTATLSITVQSVITGSSAGTRIQFDGTDDYISIDHKPAIKPTSNFTIETWVRPSNIISVGTIYSLDSTTTDTSLTINLVGLTPQLVMKTTGAYVNLLSTENTILNSWSHIAVTYDGSNLKLYVNGQIGIDTIISGTVVSKTGPVFLGRRAAAQNSLNAGMENFILWNTVRTANEIRLGMHKKIQALSNPNIVQYYQFDEGANISVLTDASGNCNPAIMNNFDVTTAWYISSLPLDTSNGSLVSFSAPGNQSFTGKNISMNFQNLSGNHDVVAHYITNTTNLGFLPDTVISSTPKFSHLRYWILYKYGYSSYDSCLATFNLPAGNLGSNSTSLLYLSNRDNGASGVWSLARNPADTVNLLSSSVRFWLPASATFTKQYGIASSGSLNPLPVTMLYFTGKRNGNDAELNWATASEKNNSHFVVERSYDGISFAAIDKVKGAGNSNGNRNYSYKDANAFEKGTSVVYYRLVQTDQDGKTTYTETIRIYKEPDEVEIRSVQPNPFDNSLILVFNLKEDVHIRIEMSGLSGQVVLDKQFGFESGYQELNLDEVSDLPAGIYFVKVQYNGKSQVFKVLKSK